MQDLDNPLTWWRHSEIGTDGKIFEWTNHKKNLWIGFGDKTCLVGTKEHRDVFWMNG